LAADSTGRGLATRVVAALSDIAATQPDVARILIYCDEANNASAAIPRRLGYHLERIVAVPPEATAETGRQQEWMIRPREWREQRAG
jgi:RimJ/RimL family protein N-acetyltransferase